MAYFSNKILFLFSILIVTFSFNVLIIANGQQGQKIDTNHNHDHIEEYQDHYHNHDGHNHNGHEHDDHEHLDHEDNHQHHHHYHANEKPSFKYSREANQQYTSNEQSTVKEEKIKLNDKYNVWASALLSTLIISLFPFLILFFIPLNNSSEHQSLLKILLSFASGGLLGDAFLHLIPHALLAKSSEHDTHSHSHTHAHTHSHNHGHSHGGQDTHNHDHDMSVGLWVLAGILAFLIIEKLIRIIKGPGHGHSHSLNVNIDQDVNEVTKEKSSPKSSPKSKSKSKSSNDKNDGDVSTETTVTKKRVHFDKDVIDKEEKETEMPSDIKVAGYLNLAADFTHNLTDGLAIGASFLAGKNIGFITSITILLHEIPHEIGDFAILIQSGCSKRKAMLLQLVTAFGAFTGTLLSLLAEGLGDVAQAWILPFTAGGFIYIATVSVIPELLEGTSLKQSISEIIALIFGVFLMVLIAKYE